VGSTGPRYFEAMSHQDGSGRPVLVDEGTLHCRVASGPLPLCPRGTTVIQRTPSPVGLNYVTAAWRFLLLLVDSPPRSQRGPANGR
jgi:hypothetical protein